MMILDGDGSLYGQLEQQIKELESEKSQLIEVVRDLVTLAEMVEDSRKMPHWHSDKALRLWCLTERAREALTKHKEILTRYGVNN
jgi:hypothetical protein